MAVRSALRSALRLAALAGFLFALAPLAAAQQGPVQRIVLLDGSVLVGTVVDADADPVVILTRDGIEQRVAQSRIAEITDLIDGRFTRLDPSRSRLFLSPTGRTLGRGNKRFSAYYVFPSLAVGASDRVDLSVGASLPFISSEGSAIAVNLNAKAQVLPLDGGGVAVGTSALIPASSADGIPGILGTVYAVATLGSATTGVTLGASGAYVTDFEDGEFGNGVLLLAGVDHQLSDSFKVLSENFLFVNEGENFGLASLGVRIFGDKLAGDAAAALVFAEGEFLTIPVPYLGVSYNF